MNKLYFMRGDRQRQTETERQTERQRQGQTERQRQGQRETDLSPDQRRLHWVALNARYVSVE